MILLRSFIFQIGMWAFTIPFTFLSILTFPLSAITRYKFISLWAKTILFWLKISCNIRFKVNGLENIPKKPFMILSKHQSAWETLAFQKIFPPQVWVLKRELLWIPFFGWGLASLKPIAIDRRAGRKALNQVVEQGRKRLDSGAWVVIFPEGTRIPTGQIGKFGMGGAFLAAETGYSIIPVAHNAGKAWPKHGFLKYPCVITIVIGNKIVIDENMKKVSEINNQVYQWMESQMTRLDGEKPDVVMLRKKKK